MMWLALLLFQNVADAKIVVQGEKIFAENCSVGYCHGVGGAAGRGPRLRGRTFAKDYLFKVVREGIPSSAMPSWKGRLREEEITAVVAYVASLATATSDAPPPNAMPPGVGPATIAAFRGPEQAGRGHRLFFEPEREGACGACHALGGRGIAVGPDLSNLGSKSARDMASAIRSNHSRHVLTATLNHGEVFPALRAEQAEKWIKLYDLSVTPPVLRTLERPEIVSLHENTDWSHAGVVKDYRPEQLADIIAYIRWASSGEKAEVNGEQLGK